MFGAFSMRIEAGEGSGRSRKVNDDGGWLMKARSTAKMEEKGKSGREKRKRK